MYSLLSQGFLQHPRWLVCRLLLDEFFTGQVFPLNHIAMRIAARLLFAVSFFILQNSLVNSQSKSLFSLFHSGGKLSLAMK